MGDILSAGFKVVWLEEGDPRPEGMDADDYGMTDNNAGTIYLSRTKNPALDHDTYVHERLHVAFFMSGAKWYLGQIAEKAGLEQDFLEELLIRMLAPALVDLVPPCA
jgi:hypothetical protein